MITSQTNETITQNTDIYKESVAKTKRTELDENDTRNECKATNCVADKLCELLSLHRSAKCVFANFFSINSSLKGAYIAYLWQRSSQSWVESSLSDFCLVKMYSVPIYDTRFMLLLFLLFAYVVYVFWFNFRLHFCTRLLSSSNLCSLTDLAQYYKFQPLLWARNANKMAFVRTYEQVD